MYEYLIFTQISANGKFIKFDKPLHFEKNSYEIDIYAMDDEYIYGTVIANNTDDGYAIFRKKIREIPYVNLFDSILIYNDNLGYTRDPDYIQWSKYAKGKDESFVYKKEIYYGVSIHKDDFNQDILHCILSKMFAYYQGLYYDSDDDKGLYNIAIGGKDFVIYLDNKNSITGIYMYYKGNVEESAMEVFKIVKKYFKEMLKLILYNV